MNFWCCSIIISAILLSWACCCCCSCCCSCDLDPHWESSKVQLLNGAGAKGVDAVANGGTTGVGCRTLSAEDSMEVEAVDDWWRKIECLLLKDWSSDLVPQDHLPLLLPHPLLLHQLWHQCLILSVPGEEFQAYSTRRWWIRCCWTRWTCRNWKHCWQRSSGRNGRTRRARRASALRLLKTMRLGTLWMVTWWNRWMPKWYCSCCYRWWRLRWIVVIPPCQLWCYCNY